MKLGYVNSLHSSICECWTLPIKKGKTMHDKPYIKMEKAGDLDIHIVVPWPFCLAYSGPLGIMKQAPSCSGWGWQQAQGQVQGTSDGGAVLVFDAGP